MNADGTERFTPGADQISNRRTALRLLVAGVAGVVASRLQQPGIARAAEDLIAAGAEGSKKKNCNNQAQACKRSAASYCAEFYAPEFFNRCTQDLYFCCNKAKTCKIQNAKNCLRNSPW